MTDVREITLSDRICARSAMSASVVPSERYSWLESPEKFSSGSTAIEWIWAAAFGLDRHFHTARPPASSTATNTAAVIQSRDDGFRTGGGLTGFSAGVSAVARDNRRKS